MTYMQETCKPWKNIVVLLSNEPWVRASVETFGMNTVTPEDFVRLLPVQQQILLCKHVPACIEGQPAPGWLKFARMPLLVNILLLCCAVLFQNMCKHVFDANAGTR